MHASRQILGSRRRVPALLLAGVLVASLGAAGRADTISRSDGNDTEGPIDLAGSKLTHVDAHQHAFQITTQEPFANSVIDPHDGNFAIAFDLNDNGHYEFVIYVYYRSGRLRGVLYNPRTNDVVTRRLRTSRVNRRTIKVVLPLSTIGNPTNYRYVVVSYYEANPCSRQDPCIDTIPNRLPLILHDYTAPSITHVNVPTFSIESSRSTTVIVSFDVSDDPYGSGVLSWLLERRKTGGSTWTEADTGGGSGSKVATFTGLQGQSYDVRIRATDRKNNVAVSAIRRAVVPYDDQTNKITITYGGPGGSSDWTAGASAAGYWLGTNNMTSVVGATLAVTGWSGSQFCLFGGVTTANVTWSFDGGTQTTESVSSSTKRGPIKCLSSTGAAEFDLTVNSGTFVLDAVGVKP